MTSVRVHAILLVIALLFAFQTWTREETSSAEQRAGDVMLWEENVERLSSVTYESPSRTLTLERRTSPDATGATYMWGIAVSKAQTADTTQTPKPEEFPLGPEGEELITRLAQFRALRDLGVLNDDAKTEYELNEPTRSLAIMFGSNTKTLTLGGTVFGGPHRYAIDTASGRGYVISNEMLRGLEGGPGSLQLRQLHRYEDTRVTGVTVRTSRGERQMRRTMDGPFAVWSRPDAPGEGDQTFANFMERVQQLSILSYEAGTNLDTLEFIVRIDYMGQEGNPIGFIEMYRTEANDDGVREYFIRTEATRIPAQTYRSFAERVDRDLADVF